MKLSRRNLLAVVIIFGAIALVAGALYSSNFIASNQQTTNTRAEVLQDKTNLCGYLNVDAQTQFIRNQDGTFKDIEANVRYEPTAYGYGLKLRIKNQKNEPVTLIFSRNTDFCRGPDNSGKLHFKDPHTGCWMGELGEPADPIFNEVRRETMEFAANETKELTIYRDSDYFAACGSYQIDWAVEDIVVGGKSTGCRKTFSPDAPGGFASILETRNACPQDKPKCTGINISYTDPTGQPKTMTSTKYDTVVDVKPGTQVCFNDLNISNGLKTKGYFAAWDISCLLTNPATCTVEQLHDKTRQNGGPKPLPTCITAATEPGKVGQLNGYLQPVDSLTGATNECGVRTRVLGAQATPTTPPNQPTPTTPPNQPTPTSVVVTAQPTRTPQLEGCGTLRFAVEACTETKTITCGSPCGEGLGECEEDHICIMTRDRNRICALKDNEQACSQNGTEGACCRELTPTPLPTNTTIPTPTPYPTFTPFPTYTPIQPNTRVETRDVQVIRPTVIVQTQEIPITAPPVVQQVQPTFTPVPPPPTYTPLPTYTPIPTQPPQPTYTPPAIPVAGNPIPWVVAGVPVVLMLLGMLL